MAFHIPGKFVYLATPHTASSSTITVFRKWEREGLGQEIKPHHILLPDMDIRLRKEVVWTVLRNPYDLIVSWWLRRRFKRGGALHSFAASWNEEPYVVGGKMYFHLPFAKRVLRYERLEEDLQALTRDLSLPKIELPRTNPTPDKKPWQTYYDDRTLEIVNERWGAEFQPFYEPIASSSMLTKNG